MQHNHHPTLFLAGVVVGATLTYWWAARCRRSAEPVRPADSHKTPRIMSNIMQDDILREHFTRTIQFFGQDAQQSLADSLVVVVGLGV